MTLFGAIRVPQLSKLVFNVDPGCLGDDIERVEFMPAFEVPATLSSGRFMLVQSRRGAPFVPTCALLLFVEDRSKRLSMWEQSGALGNQSPRSTSLPMRSYRLIGGGKGLGQLFKI